MILVAGDPREPMVEAVHAELKRRGRPVCLLANYDLPGTVSFSLGLGAPTGAGEFRSPDLRVDLKEVRSVYQRLGFSDFETFEGYSQAEGEFVSSECMAALSTLFNHLPALVVNRPVASGTNASKPFQISLVEAYGFRIPETLVTTMSDAAAEFYENHQGQVIYKSISYVRSIVQRMKPEDLERLDRLRTCPVQLQQAVEGTDIRVHVVGDRTFASLIQAEESDYRYDKKAEVVAHELDPDVARRCCEAARGLGMHLAGIDLRVSPEGEYYCFEVNPSPAFSWYEDRTGQPITAALCDLLEAGRDQPSRSSQDSSS
ncbi:MAG: hypothetical protein AB1758_20775 [Candidatus Eremiobacterota bacterium]